MIRGFIFCFIVTFFAGSSFAQTPLHLTPDTGIYVTNGGIKSYVLADSILYCGGGFDSVFKQKQGLANITYQGESYHQFSIQGEVLKAVSDGRGGTVAFYQKPAPYHQGRYHLIHIAANGVSQALLQEFDIKDIEDLAITGDTLWIINETNFLPIRSEVYTKLEQGKRESFYFDPFLTQIYPAIDDGSGGFIFFSSNPIDNELRVIQGLHLDSSGNLNEIPKLFRSSIYRTWNAGKYLIVSPNFHYADDSSSLIIINKETWQRLPVDIRINDVVDGVEVHQDSLYIFGKFTRVDGDSLPYLCRYDLNSNTLDTAWKPQPNGPVMHIEIDSQVLSIGGTFTQVLGKTVSGIIQVFRQHQDSFNYFSPVYNGSLEQFTVKGDSAIICYQNNSTLYVKAFLRTGSQISSLFQKSNANMSDIGRFGNELYIKTQYAHGFDSSHSPQVLLFNANTLERIKYTGPAIPGYVSSIANGIISTYGSPAGNKTFSSNLIGINLVDQSIVDNDWLPIKATEIEAKGRKLYLASDENRPNDFYSDKIGSLYCIDFEKGHVDTTFPFVEGEFTSLNLVDNHLIGFGYKLKVYGEPNGAGIWFDISTNQAKPWKPTSLTSVGEVAVLGGNVYTIPEYRKNSSKPLYQPVAYDSLGKKLNWSPNADQWIRGIYAHNDTLFLFGSFTAINGNYSRPYAIAIDTAENILDWSCTTQGKTNGFFTQSSGNLVLYGNKFRTHIEKRRSLFAYNLNTKELLDWKPDGGWQVDKLALTGDTLWVGGIKDIFDFFGPDALVLYDTKSLTRITGPNLNGWVHNFCFSGDNIFVNGDGLSLAGQQVTGRFMAFKRDNFAFKNWSIPSNGYALKMIPFNDEIFINNLAEETILGVKRSLMFADTLTGGLSNWAPSFDSPTLSATLWDSMVYSSGGFMSVGGKQSHYFAKFKYDVNTPFTQDYGLLGPLNDLHHAGNRVYFSAVHPAGGLKDGPLTPIGYIDSHDTIHISDVFYGESPERLFSGKGRLFGSCYFKYEVFTFQAMGEFMASVQDPLIFWQDTGSHVFCIGDTLKIGISPNGEEYGNGNRFIVYLSDHLGKEPFGRPIAVIEGDTAANIEFILSGELAASDKYRIHVVASNPLSSSSVPLRFSLKGQFKTAIEINDPEQCFAGHLFTCLNTDSLRTLSTEWQVDSLQLKGHRLDHRFAAHGDYMIKAIVSDAYCSEEHLFPVRVRQQAPVHLTVTAQTHVCDSNHLVHFYDSLPGDKMYLFDPGFGDVIRQLPVDIHFPAYGKYNFELISMDSNGCTDTSRNSLVIGDRELSEIHLLTDSSQCFLNNEFAFVAQAQNRSKTIIAWIAEFPDTTQKDTFSIHFSQPGIQSVMLISHDSNYCIDSVIKVVRVLPAPVPPAIYGPAYGYFDASDTFQAVTISGDSILWWSNFGSLDSLFGDGKILIKWPKDSLGLSRFSVGVQAMDTSGCLSDTAFYHLDLFHVSIDENTTISIQISPNPADKTLRLSGFSEDEQVLVTIYDLKGALVKRMELTGRTAYQFSTEYLMDGLYMLHVQRPDGIETFKIMIRHL